MELLILLVTILLLGFMGVLVRLFDALVLKPERLRSKLRNQGIHGPPPLLLIGNTWDMMKTRFKNPKQEEHQQQQITHNISAAIFPFFEEWRKQYGPTFVFSMGNILILHTTHPDVVKEINKDTSFNLGRPSLQQNDSFIGQGILGSSGEQWARQRKILAPEFFSEKVKGMTKLMVECALMVVESLNDKIDNEGGIAELKIDDYMRSFSGDVISRACFGSNYEQGEQIFMKIREEKSIMAKNLFLKWIPGFRYLPIKSNREIWRLEKELRALMLKVIKERKETVTPNSDLLQIILQSAESNDLGQEAKNRFVLDNCKNVYLAGFDTTAISATWTLMLLALYPEWQDKVREEVLQICAGELPNTDMLRKMKILTMVIYESLRLYSPGPIVPREAVKDLELGRMKVPKGVNVWIMLVTLHQDPNLWGPNVDKFNPERFSNGISGACKHPQGYMPFGVGPHTCLGQHFAIAELKILLIILLSKFRFTLSPKYRHSPIMSLLTEPEYGVDLFVRKI